MMAVQMPDGGLRFDTAAVTHQGHVRKFNEDSVFADPERGIWLVADGMGGHRDGNVASAMIADAARKIEPTATVAELADVLRVQIDAVNRQLLNLSNGDSDLIVGSTVAAILIRNGAYYCLWAGDSRCYMVRDGHIEQLSHDHTEVQDLVDRGVISPDEARTWPRRNVITRAVGAMHDLQLEQSAGRVLPGDCFILCSDGLTGHVEDREILAHSNRATAKQACDRLLELALTRGGKDNISIIVVNTASREETTVLDKWR